MLSRMFSTQKNMTQCVEGTVIFSQCEDDYHIIIQGIIHNVP